MKKLILLLLIIPFYGLSQNLLPISSGEIVIHDYFTLSYSEPNEQAEWVFYKLTASMLSGGVDRTDNFREDPKVKSWSATLEDYKGTGYDRGHLCPAGDMTFNITAMSESFYLSNMSPQTPSFNRGIWKTLEDNVRQWASVEKEIYVVTGPIFKDNLGTIGPSSVTIPGYYYKVIYDITDNQKMIGLILPNKKGEKTLQEYVVTVDSIEKLTGIDFFPQLNDSIETILESNVNLTLWSFNKTSQSSGGTSVQCKGTAKSTGLQCRNMTNNENGYCHLHQEQAGSVSSTNNEKKTTSTQCKATAKSTGQQCKNKTTNPNGYCSVHQSQAPGYQKPASTGYHGQCCATTKAGTRCKRQASGGSRYCWQHQ